jgi:methylated-DNA-[protein]-cysteine S-methyltransferase
MTALSWTSLRTPVGQVSVGCSPAGVARVRYGAPPEARADATGRLAEDTEDADPADLAARELADTACRELTEYFCGDRQAFAVPVDWTATAGVQRRVLTTLASTVGYGRTITYGALARAAGLTDSDPLDSSADYPQKPPVVPVRGGDPPQPPAGLPARTVGSIMAGNPIPVIVPCHRVVASDGLGGYSGGAGIEVKRWLLILEGSLPPTLDWQPMDRPG